MASLEEILTNKIIVNEELINECKIHLNYQQIESIGDIPSQFTRIVKLFLSHNHIEKLNGLEVFSNLTHLSLSHNHILDIDELYHISNKDKLSSLSISGNFLCKHPNYLVAIVSKFKGLKELDDETITESKRLLIDGIYVTRE